MAKSETTRVVKSINWSLLRRQKAWLLREAQLRNEEASGLLHLIDAIQDAAVSDKLASEAEVFA